MKTNHTIIFGDSTIELKNLKDNSVHLIITSPPYWDRKDYGSKSQIGFGQTYENYITNLNQIWKECNRILIPGRKICINIGDVYLDSKTHGRYKVVSIKTEIINYCEKELGLDYYGAIIWQKICKTKPSGGINGRFMGCYDNNTEILTDKGFILFENLSTDHKIMSLENGNMKFVKPNQFYKYNYNGEMIYIKNKSTDLCITPNHNIFYRLGKDKKFQLKPFSEIHNHSIYISGIGNWEDKERKYFFLPPVEKPIFNSTYYTKPIKILMDDWLKFLGYFLSDGFTTHTTYLKTKTNNKAKEERTYQIKKGIVGIRQIKTNTRRIIERDLDKLPINYTKTKRGFIFSNKQLYSYCSLFGKALDKYIPKYIKSLSKRQLNILYNALMVGDGHISKNNAYYYYTSSQKLRDDICEIILKLGYCPSVNTRIRKGSRNLSYEIYRRKSKTKKIVLKEHVSKIKYNGPVYCVNVPSHIIYIRRNGKCCWCGNSYPFPPNGIITLDYEYILIFKKPGASQKIDKEIKEKSKIPKSAWEKYFNGHWQVPGDKDKNHPATFPLEIPKRLIKMYSFIGETILDPFLGSGTTLLASRILKRNCIGMELNKETYWPVIKKKINFNQPGLFQDCNFKLKDMSGI